MTELQITPAHEFKAEPHLVRLPSQRVIEVKEVDLVGLIATSAEDVPDFISGMVLNGLMGNKSKATHIDKSSVKDLFGFTNTMIRAAVVRPTVVPSGADYDKGEINLDDLSTDDKIAIFNLVMPQEAGIARTFRQRVEKTNLANVRNSKSDGDQTERDTGAA